MRNGVARQGVPRVSGHHQKLGERHEMDSPSETPERTEPDNTLTVSLQKCERIQFLLL